MYVNYYSPYNRHQTQEHGFIIELNSSDYLRTSSWKYPTTEMYPNPTTYSPGDWMISDV